jgi:hypothetical protein
VKQVEQGVPKPANAEIPMLMAGGKAGSRCRAQVGFGGAILRDSQGEKKDVSESMHHGLDGCVDGNEAFEEVVRKGESKRL